MSNDYVGELNWESQIQKESDFVLLPEGDYDFVVVDLSRERHQGSDKLPACPKAVVRLQIEGPEGDIVNLKHSLFLHTKTEGMLSAFFCAIGLKKHGEPFVMNWAKVVGSTGKAKIYIDTYTTDRGEERQSNKVKKFYDKEDAPVNTAPAGYSYAQQPYQQQTFPSMPQQQNVAPNTGFNPGRF